MPADAISRLKSIPILGQQHVPSGGALIIPNRLSLTDLLQLQRLFALRPLSLLVEHGAELEPAMKSHLEGLQVHELELTPSPANLESLRKIVQGEIGRGSLVIFVPRTMASQNAPLMTVPGPRLEFLLQAQAPVLPLHVLHTAEVAMTIEQPPAPEDAVLAFGPVLASPDLASFQEAMLLLAEESFAGKPELGMHLAYALLRGLKRHGTKASIFDGKDERQFRFDKVLASAIVLAGHVRAATRKPRVGIILPPGPGTIVANIAVLFAGKTPVNLNFTASRASVDSAIRQAELDHYLTADLFVRKMQTFPWPPNRQLTFIERLLPQRKGAIARWLLLSKLLPASTLAMMLGIPKTGGAREALLLFTSGSSGEPKGVVLTHRNLMANVCQFGARLRLGHGDSILASLPLFHSFGCTVSLWYPVIQGISVVTYPNPVETKRLAELVHKHRVTLMIATPTFLRSYLKGVNPEWLASLKLVVTGAEKLPRAVADAFESRFGKPVHEGYGLTETSPVTNVNLPDPGPPESAVPSHRFGSVGQLLPGLAMRVTHPDTGAPLSTHQSGIIWFKGPNVFEGYLKDPKRTDEVLKDGWFRTGDIGRLDADGFLHIEGRLSRFSKIGGEMVPHETVEDSLIKALNLEGDSARRIAVIGVPDIEKGEALVLLTAVPGGNVQQEILDLRYKLLDRGVPPLWIPKKMLRVPEIPVLASGKLDITACEKLARTAGW